MDPTAKALAEAAAALQRARAELAALSERVAETRRRTEELATLYARDLESRAALGGFGSAKLLADAIALEGSLSARRRVRRLEVGEPVTRSFADWVGVTRCASEADDVRRLWELLLSREAQSGGVLRGDRSTVLDIPDALVSLSAGRPYRGALVDRTLCVSLRDQEIRDQGSGIGDQETPAPRIPNPESQIPGIVAVPRFTYALPPRKLRNVGHWLVDCLPQAAVLAMVAPDARLLLPGAPKPYQRWTLSALGFRDDQLVPWDGSAVSCQRLLAFESDGRVGGGRPLSALMELRKRWRAGAAATGGRRIFVSRRDARARRRWVGNQPEIEALFQSRGFEVLSMAECPLDEQARIFRDAHIVAGISGAGLTNLIYSAPGSHAIVLVSDSLVRWYAETGSKSLWARGTRGGPGQLAALGDSPRFYAHLAAAFEQTCHYFVGPDEMPLGELTAFLDAVLEGL